MSSFQGLDNWIEELKKHGPNNLSMCIAGNKKDLEDERQVAESLIKKKAKSIDSSYILTSALDDEGIEVRIKQYFILTHQKEAFIEIVRNISIGRFTSIKGGMMP